MAALAVDPKNVGVSHPVIFSTNLWALLSSSIRLTKCCLRPDITCLPLIHISRSYLHQCHIFIKLPQKVDKVDTSLLSNSGILFVSRSKYVTIYLSRAPIRLEPPVKINCNCWRACISWLGSENAEWACDVTTAFYYVTGAFTRFWTTWL